MIGTCRRVADGGKHAEIDRGTQRGGALVRLRGVEEEIGSRKRVGGHGDGL
jgi:hypothetical protein